MTWPFPFARFWRAARTFPLTSNVEEVRELLAQTQARIASVEDVVMALERLVTDGHAEVKELGGGRWYTIAMETRRIGFRPGG